jgi:hypothetical protein
MKGILLLIIGLLSVQVLGQQVLPVQHDTLRHKHEFTLTGNLELNATSIERAISSKMALGGLITNDLKDRSLAKHKDVNRVGLDLQGEFEWRNGAVNVFKREKFGFLIKTGAYTIGSGAYSTDLFRLAYYGNQPFLGEILNFDGTGFQTTSFQKVGFGIFDKINKSSISLNVVNVSSHTNADLKNAEMLSYEDGDSVSMLLNGGFKTTTGSSFSQGLGVCVDVDIRMPIMWFNQKEAIIQFQAKNLGFAYMYAGMREYRVDSSYSYSGFSVQQLLNNDALFDENFSLLDSLQVFQRTTKSGIALPGFVQVGKIVNEQSSSKLQSFFGVRMYPTLFYRPFVFVGLDYKPIQALHIGAHVNMGGFGLIRTGLYASYLLSDWALGAGTEDLFSAFSDKGMGAAYSIRISKRLN